MCQAKHLYFQLLDSGCLPSDMTKNWDKDKKSFIRQFKEDQELYNVDYKTIEDLYEDDEDY